MRQVLLAVSPSVDVAHRAVEELHRTVAGVGGISAGRAGLESDRHRYRFKDRAGLEDAPHGVVAHGVCIYEILSVVGVKGGIARERNYLTRVRIDADA